MLGVHAFLPFSGTLPQILYYPYQAYPLASQDIKRHKVIKGKPLSDETNDDALFP
jgi:hypothetical protein